MVVHERADVVVRASFSRREAIERAQTRGAVRGDPVTSAAFVSASALVAFEDAP